MYLFKFDTKPTFPARHPPGTFLRAPTPDRHPLPTFTATYTAHLPSNYFSLSRAETFFLTGSPTHQLGGLINIGYNCYVNVVIQALAYTPGFPHFCLHLPNVLYQHNSDSTFFLDSLARIFAELDSRRSISPIWILQDAGQLAECFRRPLQQDAHEFLLHLLDIFERECSSAVFGSKETLISHFFTCELTVALKCKFCGNVTTRETRCHDLEVSMTEFEGVEAITSAGEFEIQGKCEICERTESLLKSNRFTKMPLILIVTLLRFDNELKKIEDFLRFPKVLRIKGELEYCLYAVVLHLGKGINHGHFVAFVMAEGGCWYRVDDATVFRMKEEVVMGSCPYMLFYKRINL
jgi:uncharacterized UBP type Zn finger protein